MVMAINPSQRAPSILPRPRNQDMPAKTLSYGSPTGQLKHRRHRRRSRTPQGRPSWESIQSSRALTVNAAFRKDSSIPEKLAQSSALVRLAKPVEFKAIALTNNS